MISVIVPVYNVESYLERCIESILNQTYRNLEIILINDGSTDGSKEICDKYRRKDSRVIVVNQDNKGVSSARNLGLELAKGDYIAFVDSDDYLEKDMYELLINCSNESNADIIVCGFLQMNSKGEKKESFIKNSSGLINSFECMKRYFNDSEIKEIMYAPWNKLFKKEVLRSVRFDENLSMGEDILFIFRCLENSQYIFINNQCKYNYIYRVDSAMRTKFSEKRFDYIKAFDKMEQICTEKYPIILQSLREQNFYHKLNCCRNMIIYSHYKKKYKLEYENMLKYLDMNKSEVIPKMMFKRKVDYLFVRYIPYIYIPLKKMKAVG